MSKYSIRYQVYKLVAFGCSQILTEFCFQIYKSVKQNHRRSAAHVLMQLNEREE